VPDEDTTTQPVLNVSTAVATATSLMIGYLGTAGRPPSLVENARSYRDSRTARRQTC
jgi:hypothetical protein